MAGEIGIEPNPEGGTKFWFTGSFEKQQVISSDRPKAIDFAGKRVLIVDGNAASRGNTNSQAVSLGLIPSQTGSGAEAIEMLCAAAAVGHSFEIVLSNLVLPDMDCFKMAKTIKADPEISDVLLVILPLHGERGHAHRAVEAGIAGYLQKPVSTLQLYNGLCSIVASKNTPASIPRLITNHSLRELNIEPLCSEELPTRIVLAEDNIVNQKVALGQLKSLGDTAGVANNGLELLKILETSPADIVLMDCNMPEMDGFAATREIRRREGNSQHTIVIAMTANALEGDREKCLAAGMDDYLSKPVKAKMLGQKLQHWIAPGIHTSLMPLMKGSIEPVQEGEACSVIDPAVLGELKELQQPDGADFLTELIDLYLSDSVTRLETISSAIAIDDKSEVRRIAHLMRGSSSNMGAHRMATLYGSLETNTMRNDWTKGAQQELLNQLEHEFIAVGKALRAERLVEGVAP